MIYFKKLAHMIVDADKSETCGASHKATKSGKSRCCCLESKFHRASQALWKLKQGFHAAFVTQNCCL